MDFKGLRYGGGRLYSPDCLPPAAAGSDWPHGEGDKRGVEAPVSAIPAVRVVASGTGEGTRWGAAVLGWPSSASWSREPKERKGLFLTVSSGKTRGYNNKWWLRRLEWKLGKAFLFGGQCSAGAGCPGRRCNTSLEIFRTWLNKTMADLIWCSSPALGRQLDYMTSRSIPNNNISVIMWKKYKDFDFK